MMVNLLNKLYLVIYLKNWRFNMEEWKDIEGYDRDKLIARNTKAANARWV